MAQSGKRELLDRIEEMEAENEDLQYRLDEISDIVGEQEDADEGSDEGDDQGEE